MTSPLRVKLAVLVGMILASFIATASASAANVSWEMTYPGGRATSSGSNATCTSVPCTVTGRITSTNGQSITGVSWYPTGQSSPITGTGTDYHATWTYTEVGTYDPSFSAHYSDGSNRGDGPTLRVTDGRDATATVSYQGPDTLYEGDDARNTFVVTTNAPHVNATWVSLSAPGNPAGVPTVLRDYSDASGHHFLMRINNAPAGSARLGLSAYWSDPSAGAQLEKPLQFVGPPPDFWNLLLKSSYRKTRTQCSYTTALQVSARQGGTARVRLVLQGRLPHSRWRTLLKRSTTKTYASGRVKASAVIKFGTKRSVVASFARRHAGFRLVFGPDVLTSSSAKKTLTAKRRTLSARRVLGCQL